MELAPSGEALTGRDADAGSNPALAIGVVHTVVNVSTFQFSEGIRMLLACAAQSASRPRVPNQAPPVEFIRTGTVSPTAEHLVRYVDDDASGELRLIETSPIYPARIAQ